MKVRPVEPRDRDAWLRMRRGLWPDEPDPHAAEIDAWLRDRASSAAVCVEVLVAERDEGGLCGLAEIGLRPHAEVTEERPVAYLEGLWVDPDRRRMGAARALLAGVEAWARARGRTELASDFRLENDVSRAWHAAAGFAEVETLVLVKKRL
jgi:aminoglycoside 6'-N-acetyltransferase I